MQQVIEERVETLENVLRQFIVHTDAFLEWLENGLIKVENNLIKVENNLIKLEDNVAKLENALTRLENDTEKDRREMNKRWGELANKMGTLDEDLIAPATRPVLGKYFKCKPTTRTIRVLRRMNDKDFEVDVLVVCDNKVFMIEVRSSPRTEYVNEILRKAAQFKKFFPEYKDKELIPIYAGLLFPENVIKYATKKGLYLMAYREFEYMDIINFEELKR